MKLSKFLVLMMSVVCLPYQSYGGAGSHGGNLIENSREYTIMVLDSVNNAESGLCGGRSPKLGLRNLRAGRS